MFLVSSWSCPCPIHWSQVFSREWGCSWSSADRRCSNYIWVRLILEPHNMFDLPKPIFLILWESPNYSHILTHTRHASSRHYHCSNGFKSRADMVPFAGFLVPSWLLNDHSTAIFCMPKTVKLLNSITRIPSCWLPFNSVNVCRSGSLQRCPHV